MAMTNRQELLVLLAIGLMVFMLVRTVILVFEARRRDQTFRHLGSYSNYKRWRDYLEPDGDSSKGSD